jgi:hypothetical protein
MLEFVRQGREFFFWPLVYQVKSIVELRHKIPRAAFHFQYKEIFRFGVKPVWEPVFNFIPKVEFTP